MGQTYRNYAGCCVDSDARSIHAMVDQGRDVTYQTVLKHVPRDLIAEIFPYYAWGPGQPGELRLKDDWAVSYYRSIYRRKPCYFIQHSAIEYIFTL